MLRAHLTELIERDNMQGVSVAGVEFVNIMLALERLPDMAPIVEYLEATLLAEAAFFEALVATALAALREMPRRFDPSTPTLTDRSVAQHMRAMLDTRLTPSMRPFRIA